MSHFTVLVIGDNVEKQLAPYEEFECSGNNTEYIKDVDVTEEALASAKASLGKLATAKELLHEALECYGLTDKVVSDELEIDKNGNHKFGYAIVKDGELIKMVNRTNPNSKWDWYVIGGRWNGFFKLKPNTQGLLGKPGIQHLNNNYVPPDGDRADQAHKGDIDFDAIKKEAIADANKEYDLYVSVTNGLPIHQSWETIKHNNSDIESARSEYHKQPAIIALNKNDETKWFDADRFLGGRKAYTDRASIESIRTFAVIKDGKWYERGSMGWWGSISDEKDVDEWNQQYMELLNDLSDDTLLTVVDCHI
jgi:hypothetical protein